MEQPPPPPRVEDLFPSEQKVRQRTRRSFWNRHGPKVVRFIHALWHYKWSTQFPVSLCRPQLNSWTRRRIFLTACTRDHVRLSTRRRETARRVVVNRNYSAARLSLAINENLYVALTQRGQAVAVSFHACNNAPHSFEFASRINRDRTLLTLCAGNWLMDNYNTVIRREPWRQSVEEFSLCIF